MSDHLAPQGCASQCDLALEALLYCSDSMTTRARTAFEDRLADDQRARDALSAAVALVDACSSDAAQGPDPAYRDRLRKHLLPPRGLLGRLCSRRPYSGHPLAWGIVGAVAATLAFLMLLPALSTPGALPGPVAAVPAEPVLSADRLEEARRWEAIPRGEHLFATHQEERRRRLRQEISLRLVKRDDASSAPDHKTN